MFRQMILNALRQLTEETETADEMARGCRRAGRSDDAQRRSSQAAEFARRHGRMLDWAMTRERR